MDKNKLQVSIDSALLFFGVFAASGLVLLAIWDWFLCFLLPFLKPLTFQSFVGLALLLMVVGGIAIALAESKPSK